MATGVVPYPVGSTRNDTHYQVQTSLDHDQYSSVAAEGVHETTRAGVAKGGAEGDRGGYCQV